MKTKINTFTLLLLCGFTVFTNAVKAQSQSKEIKKEFQVSKGDILEIENKFGDIEILNWDRPEISISVKLSADSRNDAAAKSLIEKMSVEIKKENSTINAYTIINNESGMSQGSHFAVNYTVYAPGWINLNLVNKFGNIRLEEINGIVNIDLKHGNLSITKLGRGNQKPFNQLNMAYSNGVIDNAGSLKLVLSFSKLEVEEAEFFVAESKYSGINVASCTSFDCESKYDNFKFSELRYLKGNLQYSNLRTTEFSGKLELESSYSGVKIDKLLPSFESIKINNVRGAYKIGVQPETSFELYADSNRGDVSIEGFEILEKKTEGSNKFIHASGGTEGLGKVISVTMQDGALSLYKN